MTDPRAVRVTEAQLRTLTPREMAQALKVTGIRRAEAITLLAQASDDYGDPDDTARGIDLLWAMAWQIVRREERTVSWEDAKEWDVVVVPTPPAEVALEDDLVEMRVEAAILTGLPIDDAQDGVTMAELDAYRRIRTG